MKKHLLSESNDSSFIPEEVIFSRIFLIRNLKVMVDSDLADLYGVSTKRLNEQVKRNAGRFPEDFMFQLTSQEKKEVVANCDHLYKLRFSSYLPYVFTEHGAVMLASILNSPRAIKANIQIVRVFIKSRQILEFKKEILNKLEQIQNKDKEQDHQILLLFEYIRQMEQVKEEEIIPQARKPVGY